MHCGTDEVLAQLHGSPTMMSISLSTPLEKTFVALKYSLNRHPLKQEFATYLVGIMRRLFTTEVSVSAEKHAISGTGKLAKLES